MPEEFMSIGELCKALAEASLGENCEELQYSFEINGKTITVTVKVEQ